MASLVSKHDKKLTSSEEVLKVVCVEFIVYFKNNLSILFISQA
jgi:hypothetical protein